MPGAGAPVASYTVPNTTAFWACKAGTIPNTNIAINSSRRFLLIAVLLETTWDDHNHTQATPAAGRTSASARKSQFGPLFLGEN